MHPIQGEALMKHAIARLRRLFRPRHTDHASGRDHATERAAQRVLNQRDLVRTQETDRVRQYPISGGFM